MQYFLSRLSALLVGLLFVFSACQKDNFITTSGADLVFSLDTLSFDTVFTDLGTATRRFKVFNPHNRAIQVSSIRLAGGTQSDFRLNIDGSTGPRAENIEIAGGDSIYIFANVRIDPNDGDALRYDSILFETNGSLQKVILEAYGWNAIYIGQQGYLTRYTQSQYTFNDQQPYILFGIVAFDTNSVVQIEPAAQIFMHGGPRSQPGDRAQLYIGYQSSLKCGLGGDLNNPVEFKTHRLEEDYQEIPFQHDGIVLSRYSRDNQIENTIIRNANIGITVDSLSINANPKLQLKNTLIYNTDQANIAAIEGSIYAENSLFANSNNYGGLFIRGGDLEFAHCSFVNFSTNVFIGRNESVLNVRDYQVTRNSANEEIILLSNGRAQFNNCIIYGNTREEIVVDKADPRTVLDFGFNHCLVRVDTFAQRLNNCLINQPPTFVDPQNYDYRLEANSPGINIGSPIGIFSDALGTPRDAQPDAGAYEFVP